MYQSPTESNSGYLNRLTKKLAGQLKSLNGIMCTMTDVMLAQSSSSCPPIPPSVTPSTVKCCIAGTCDIVWMTTTTTVPYVLDPASSPGSGGLEVVCDPASPCKKSVQPVDGGPEGPTCTYIPGAPEIVKVCTDSDGAVIDCPENLIPNCDPPVDAIVPVPGKVCIDQEGKCIEGIPRYDIIKYDCLIPLPPECYGYMIDGAMVPCDEVIETECPVAIVLNSPHCPPDINIEFPEPCIAVDLDECPTKK